MNSTTRLRQLLSQEGRLVAGACYDALSGRLAELSGFRVLYATGFGIEATQLASPDIGLMTMTELITHVGHIAAAVSLPVIADSDDGWGSVQSVTRAVREWERAGIAGIHLEDQRSPKRCPLLDGREVLPRQEAVGRIRAACAARTDSDFVIIARTDADEIGVDELIARGNLYLEAGADVVMPMTNNVAGNRRMPAAERKAIQHRLVNEIRGPVLLIGEPRDVDPDCKVVFAMSALTAVTGALQAVYRELVETGSAEGYFALHPAGPSGLSLMKILGVERWLEMERDFGSGRTSLPELTA